MAHRSEWASQFVSDDGEEGMRRNAPSSRSSPFGSDRLELAILCRDFRAKHERLAVIYQARTKRFVGVALSLTVGGFVFHALWFGVPLAVALAVIFFFEHLFSKAVAGGRI